LVVEEGNVEPGERGVGGERRGERVLAQRLGELARLRLELDEALVLRLDLVDAQLELAGGRLDLLERLPAPLEGLAPFAQLRVDLGRHRLVPQLELAARVLEDD